MIPVFVISLKDCADRRNSISKNLDILGISFEFVDAIDGRNGLPSEYEGQIDRGETALRGRVLDDVEYACSLSHIKVYRKILDDDIPWALILEDDAIPLFDLVPYLENKYYDDAQFTQLIFGMPIYVRRKSQKIIFGKYRSYLCSMAKTPRSAVGYVVSNEAAKYFINNGIPVNHAADWPYCINQLIKNQEYRIVYPPLIHHDPLKKSLLDHYGRSKIKKERRRFFGIYVPPIRGILDTLNRSPHKIFAKRINS